MVVICGIFPETVGVVLYHQGEPLQMPHIGEEAVADCEAPNLGRALVSCRICSMYLRKFRKAKQTMGEHHLLCLANRFPFLSGSICCEASLHPQQGYWQLLLSRPWKHSIPNPVHPSFFPFRPITGSLGGYEILRTFGVEECG